MKLNIHAVRSRRGKNQGPGSAAVLGCTGARAAGEQASFGGPHYECYRSPRLRKIPPGSRGPAVVAAIEALVRDQEPMCGIRKLEEVYLARRRLPENLATTKGLIPGVPGPTVPCKRGDEERVANDE